jgi:hypothetical protein
MKRLAWLLLAVFCTALAQVQPVDLPVTKVKSCCHSDAPCGCGMPGCGLPPAQAPVVFTAAQPVQVAGISLRREAQPRQAIAAKFYACFLEPVTASVAPAPSALRLSAARMPLFKAHCSFLI